MVQHNHWIKMQHTPDDHAGTLSERTGGRSQARDGRREAQTSCWRTSKLRPQASGISLPLPLPGAGNSLRPQLPSVFPSVLLQTPRPGANMGLQNSTSSS